MAKTGIMGKPMAQNLQKAGHQIFLSQHHDQAPAELTEAGAIGLETLLAASLRLYHSGEVPLLRLVDALSTAPARRFGLEGGTLSPAAVANLALIDLDEPWIVREEALLSRSKNTCFEGARMQGRVLQTMVAGRTVFQAENHR